MMRKSVSLVTLLVFMQGVFAQAPEEALRTMPAEVRREMEQLRPGHHATLQLTGGRRLEGEVRMLHRDSLHLRVGRGPFRHRMETVPYVHIIALHRRRPRRARPALLVCVVVGVAVAVAVCVAAGACRD